MNWRRGRQRREKSWNLGPIPPKQCCFSKVNNIQEDGLNKKRHVQIKHHSGTTTLDLKDIIKPAFKGKPDLIFIHAGTNDLTDDQVNTSETLVEVFEAARQRSQVCPRKVRT